VAGLGPRVAVGVEVLALLGRARLAVVVELENDVAFVVRHEGLDLGTVLAVALAEVDATAHLVRVVGRGAVAELGLYLWTYSACDNWRTMKPEVYVSTDIEADGPIPGDYSMIALGAVIVEPGLQRTFHGKLRLNVSYFSRWQDYRQRNDRDEIRSMEKRMQDIYAHYRIPPRTPYFWVASSAGDQDWDAWEADRWRGRLSPDDQRRFDSYYSRWLDYRRTNNRSEMSSMERRMQDVMSHYEIPDGIPYEQIASR